MKWPMSPDASTMECYCNLNHVVDIYKDGLVDVIMTNNLKFIQYSLTYSIDDTGTPYDCVILSLCFNSLTCFEDYAFDGNIFY